MIHCKRRIASIIVTAQAAPKIATNNKSPCTAARPQPSAASAESMTNSRTRGSKQSRASCKVRVSQHLFHSKISVTLESIASEQRPTGSGCSSYRSGPLIDQGEADREGAYKSMNHARKYLAQANRQIAELAVQIAAQRVIVRHALDTGQRSEMAESLLDALEGSLRIFEKHRVFLLSCSVNRPSKKHSSHQ